MARRLSARVRLLNACARWLEQLARAIYARTRGGAEAVEPAAVEDDGLAGAPTHWLARVRSKGPPADWLERVRRARRADPHADFANLAKLDRRDARPAPQEPESPLPEEKAEGGASPEQETARVRPRATPRPSYRKALRFHKATPRFDADDTKPEELAQTQDGEDARQAGETLPMAPRRARAKASRLGAFELNQQAPNAVDALRADDARGLLPLPAAMPTAQTNAPQVTARPGFLDFPRARTTEKIAKQQPDDAARVQELGEPRSSEQHGERPVLRVPARARHDTGNDARSAKRVTGDEVVAARSRVSPEAENMARSRASEWTGHWPAMVTRPDAAQGEDARLAQHASQEGREAVVPMRWAEMRGGDAGAGREYAPLDLSFELSFEPSTRGWPSLPDDAAEGGATEPLTTLRDWERRQRLDAEQRGA